MRGVCNAPECLEPRQLSVEPIRARRARKSNFVVVHLRRSTLARSRHLSTCPALRYDRGGYRPGLRKDHWRLQPGSLMPFDPFASVEPNISNVVEVFFAGVLEGGTLKREHCLFDDVLVHRNLVERPSFL